MCYVPLDVDIIRDTRFSLHPITTLMNYLCSVDVRLIRRSYTLSKAAAVLVTMVEIMGSFPRLMKDLDHMESKSRRQYGQLWPIQRVPAYAPQPEYIEEQ